MKLENIIFSLDGEIAKIIINRPKVLNALNGAVLSELDYVLGEIEPNDSIKGLVICGEGEKAFVAGADIKEFQNLTVDEARRLSKKGQDIFRRLENLNLISIAIVDGFALGGGLELAMSCTFRYGTFNGAVGQPEVKLGLIPGYGGTQRLTRLIGHSKALEICMTGRIVNAEEAYKIGLLDRLVKENPIEEAISSIQKMMKNSPMANIYCKKAIMEGKEMPFDTALDLESYLFGLCFATEDMKEGVSAFIEKRKPDFKGK